MCKLDIEKAYDHISCDAFIYLLGEMGFGEKWKGWIHSCISVVHSFFSNSWRLRQDDQLSILFFILIMEVLGLILCLDSNLGENSYL